MYGLIVSRVRVYPGILFDQDTNLTVYLDCIRDLTRHPLFGLRNPENGNADRFRPRSVPQRNLNVELPSDLGLEPDSLAVSEVARANAEHADQSQNLFGQNHAESFQTVSI